MKTEDLLSQIVDMNEAAALLEGRVSPTTLRHQAQAGRLRARLVGKTWITTRDEALRYGREQLGNAGRPARPNIFDGRPGPNIFDGQQPRRHSKWSEVKRRRGAIE